jgi:diguanylate cyclase (GGDEF)-like protein
MRFAIRFRLGVLLAAFGIFATGLTGLYSYTQSRTLLLRVAERDLLGATQVFGRRLATAVRDVGDDVRLLAELELTRGIVASPDDDQDPDKRALADIFHAILRANPQYFQVRLISAADHGLELVRVDRDGQGTVRVIGPLLQEKGHFPYVFSALTLRASELFLSKIGINHELGSHAALNQPTLHVSSPVVTSAGSSLGLVVVSVDIGRVFGELKADLPSHLRLFLANEWGDLLIHPDASQTFGFDQGRRVLVQDSFPDVQALLQRAGAPVLAQAQAGPQGAGPMLGAFIRQPLDANRDASVPQGEQARFVLLGVAEPLSDITAATRALGRTTVQIVLALSAIAILLATFAARMVTRPLNQMTREVKRFSTERAIGELPTGRHDEIGELARGFDEMRGRISSAMTELDASRNRMAHMARHDTLTGLPNRAVFIDRLEHAILSTRRNGGCLAVLFLDLDRFKRVNDTHGHAIGDLALVQSAQRMKSTVREVDTVARWGGDEFVILLEAMDEEHEARRVAETLLNHFTRPMRLAEMEIDVGISIGISLYPRDAFDAAELIQRADEAMYLSKHREGNRYSVFGSEMGPESVK